MAVEILTVSLSDESIEALANRVAQLVRMDALNTRPTTESNPPLAQNPQSAEASGFQQQADPWTNSAAPQEAYATTQQAPPQQPQYSYGNPPQTTPTPPPPAGSVPTCQHGPMRYVQAGFSQNSGRAYPAFYGCPRPRGAQDKCASVPA